MERKLQIPMYPLPHTCTVSHVINIRHHMVHFTKDDPTLTHPNHPKSIVGLRFHALYCTFYGLDRCVMAYTHHLNITHGIFTALKILCALPIHLSPPTPSPTATTGPSYCLHSFTFSIMSYRWNHTVCQLFILASFI